LELDYGSELFSKTLKYLGPPPPPCPKCQKPLDRIEVERYDETIRWDRDVAKYESSNRIPSSVFICPYCKEKIGGRFANGKIWGFDPKQAKVIGHVELEEEKEMLRKLKDRLSTERESSNHGIPYG